MVFGVFANSVFKILNPITYSHIFFLDVEQMKVYVHFISLTLVMNDRDFGDGG